MRVQVPLTGDNGRITAIQAVGSDGEPRPDRSNVPGTCIRGCNFGKVPPTTCILQVGKAAYALPFISSIVTGNIDSQPKICANSSCEYPPLRHGILLNLSALFFGCVSTWHLSPKWQ